jgi:hypothetical protein
MKKILLLTVLAFSTIFHVSFGHPFPSNKEVDPELTLETKDSLGDIRFIAVQEFIKPPAAILEREMKFMKKEFGEEGAMERIRDLCTPIVKSISIYFKDELVYHGETFTGRQAFTPLDGMKLRVHASRGDQIDGGHYIFSNTAYVIESGDIAEVIYLDEKGARFKPDSSKGYWIKSYRK